MSKICVVVLNWNGWEDTLACIQSLLESKPSPDRIVICDNASTDGSCDHIVKNLTCNFNYRFVSIRSRIHEALNRSPQITIFQNEANAGFAAGNNPGIRYAMDRDADFIWLLNNDTVVLPDTLAHLILCSQAYNEAGIWGSTIVYDHAPEKIQCAGGNRYCPVTSITRPALEGMVLSQVLNISEPRIDYIYGASFFVSNQIFKTIGLLNERYFLFYEELDFCIRAKHMGYSIFWCRNSIVRHKSSRSINRLQSKGKSAAQKIAYHENYSTLLFTRFHYPAYLPLLIPLRFAGKIFFIFLRRDFHLLQPLLRAYRNFLFDLMQK